LALEISKEAGIFSLCCLVERDEMLTPRYLHGVVNGR
jgi:hypothetical protein